MDVSEQGNPEIHHIAAEGRLRFLRAAERHSQCRCRRHRPHSGNICRSVVLHHIQRIPLRVEPRCEIQDCHPDKVSRHDDQDNLDEYRKLLRDRPLIGQGAEGKSDKHRKDRDHNLSDNGKDDLLKFLQQVRHRHSIVPCAREAEQHGKYKCAHHRHDLRDLQLEHNLRQLLQPLHIRHDGQMGDDAVSRRHG